MTAMRRQRFARRQSSIGAMVMTNKFDDNEMRRRFRTYERQFKNVFSFNHKNAPN